jgi:hypothetical protein
VKKVKKSNFPTCVKLGGSAGFGWASEIENGKLDPD